MHYLTPNCGTIILLNGAAGSGKDASAELLLDEFGFVRVAFADELKQDCADHFKIPVALFHSTTAKDKPDSRLNGQTPRSVMIERALIARLTDPEIYCRSVGHAITQHLIEGRDNIVISDLRYRTELNYIIREFGDIANILCFKIIRPDVTPSDSLSEHDLDDFSDWNAIIYNTGTISDLRTLWHRLMRKHLHH